MARSLIREGQVVDEDFLSHTEHDDPNQQEVVHKFIHNSDVPTTYSGASKMFLTVNDEETGIEFTSVSGTGTITEEQIINWDSKEPGFTKKTAFNKDFGTVSGTVTEGNDTRLSNVVAGVSDGIMSHEDKSVLDNIHGFKNKLINSNFKLWQRGTTASSGAGYVTADRWSIAVDGGTLSGQRSSINPGAIAGSESKFCMRLEATSIDVGANDYLIFLQRIEGVETLSGSTATFSFWVWCATALKIAVSFRQDFGTGGSPSAQVNFIPATGHQITCVAETWTKFTMTVDIPSISGKTLGTSGDDYLALLMWFSAGSDREGSPYFITIGNQCPFGNSFYIADLLLEAGPVATQYPNIPYSIEALRCYRYYWRNRIGQLNANAYADNVLSSFRFYPPCPMRTTPTAVSVFTNCSYSFVDGMVWDVLNSNTVNGGLLYFYSNCPGTNKTNIFVTFSATDYVALNAEL
jgi:hypothetical protein